MFLLPFLRDDLIIGSTWVATLGPQIVDYAILGLKFFHQGKCITLQVQDPSLFKVLYFIILDACIT